MKIYLLAQDETSRFAAEELCRILRAVGVQPVMQECAAQYQPETDALWLGTLAHFPQIAVMQKNPDEIDDEIYISTQGERGVIAGLAPRSLLIAVYRYATELGCRFLSVGREGEYLPKIDVAASAVSVHEVPSYRHRGVCIEGAVSRENVCEMIDFLPKLGMNSYFIQFREAYTFFARWYRHEENPHLQSDEPYPVEEARACCAAAAKEMKKRGIVHHAVGHGWTCEPFGVPGLAWKKWTEKIPDETLKNFAMINGVRALCDGVPLNTNDCYSNPDVRAKIVENICEYAEDHPAVDVLHVWLADGGNNLCECENCRTKRPSDWYVILLNELDAELTRRGNNTKIVFLIYVDLLWAPKQERLRNPARFIMMFAPITRSYRKSFTVDSAVPELPEFSLNHNAFPRNVSENVAHLRAWQKIFTGDSFDYDYHFMWAHWNDPGMIRLSATLHDDICRLEDIGLSGYISCQLGRCMFPNALNMVTMGRTLWDKSTPFHDIAHDYYQHAYGAHGAALYTAMSQLADLYYELNLEGVKWEKDLPRAEKCREILAFLENFTVPDEDGLAFTYMRDLKALWTEHIGILILVFSGERYDVIEPPLLALRDKVWAHEPEVQPVFDCWGFQIQRVKFILEGIPRDDA